MAVDWSQPRAEGCRASIDNFPQDIFPPDLLTSPITSLTITTITKMKIEVMGPPENVSLPSARVSGSPPCRIFPKTGKNFVAISSGIFSLPSLPMCVIRAGGRGGRLPRR